MAVRVKVNRLKLLARLEAVRDESKKKHQQALKKYAGDLIKARQAAARDLRKKADKMDDLKMYVRSDMAYRSRNRQFNALTIESSVQIPEKPEEHRALREVERAIALLDQSDDERISISTDDTRYYGIGSLTGLEE